MTAEVAQAWETNRVLTEQNNTAIKTKRSIFGVAEYISFINIWSAILYKSVCTYFFGCH